MCLVGSYLDIMVASKYTTKQAIPEVMGHKGLHTKKMMLKSHGLLNQPNVHSEEQGESDGRD